MPWQRYYSASTKIKEGEPPKTADEAFEKILSSSTPCDVYSEYPHFLKRLPNFWIMLKLSLSKVKSELKINEVKKRISEQVFVSARGQVNLLRYLTVESNGPTSNVKHWIKLTMRPGVTWMLLKFLFLVDTADWRRSSLQLVWFSLAFPLDSFSRTCSNSFSRSMLTTIVAGNRF